MTTPYKPTSGVLSPDNVAMVAQFLRDLLVGKEYFVACVDDLDPFHPGLQTRFGHLENDWTDGNPDPLRVSGAGVQGDFVDISFSGSDGYLYSFGSRSPFRQTDKQNTRYKIEPGKITFTGRAPAGTLCIHQFVALPDVGR